MSGDYSRDSGRHGGSSRNYSSRDDRRDRDRGHRRRSRSPQRSRRDYEVDTYSSSREYREREREDTYTRRERRDDRGWGDSYSRRDSRRDDDRYGRRDRDEDRGGRGRRDRDRDGYGGRERKKSSSPPIKKREPTPDLSNVIKVQDRQRRITQWDIKPAGYENITAEQAKLSGMFPLPGNPRVAQDPSRLQALINQPANSAAATALKPATSKQSRRVIVTNLPVGATRDEVIEFFNLQLNGLNVVSGENPCTEAQTSDSARLAIVEFKDAQDATMALALDGISMREGPDSPGLTIMRPRDYIGPPASNDEYVEGVVSTTVPDSPNKLSITNIGPYVDETQMRELCEAFGALRGFVLAQYNNGQSIGVAFVEYVDPEITDAAIEGLSAIALSEQNLKVQRASVGRVTQAATHDGGVGAMTMLAGSKASGEVDRSPVIMLLNAVTPDELLNSQDYREIKEDLQEGCSRFGMIVDIKIPRPSSAGARNQPGVGKVYIKYDSWEAAAKAVKGLAGQTFGNRTILCTLFSEDMFDTNTW